MKVKLNPKKYNELLIGCGSRWEKDLWVKGHETWSNLVALDHNNDHKPHVIWDLMEMPLPFADEVFDEIHAYEVLEHTGTQGDYRFFFTQFSEFYRLLKPGGIIVGSCPRPNTPSALADPSHSRIVQKENFIFLDQNEYTNRVGKTRFSDFRNIYKGDFSFEHYHENGDSWYFMLKAVKPSRISI